MNDKIRPPCHAPLSLCVLSDVCLLVTSSKSCYIFISPARLPRLAHRQDKCVGWIKTVILKPLGTLIYNYHFPIKEVFTLFTKNMTWFKFLQSYFNFQLTANPFNINQILFFSKERNRLVIVNVLYNHLLFETWIVIRDVVAASREESWMTFILQPIALTTQDSKDICRQSYFICNLKLEGSESSM